MSKQVRAISIDPGIRNTGLAVIHWDRQRYALKHCETVKTDANLELPARLTLICEKVSDAIQTFKPRSVVYRGRVFQQKRIISNFNRYRDWSMCADSERCHDAGVDYHTTGSQESVNRARGCSQANRDGSLKQTFQHARDEQSRSRRYRNRHGGYS